MKTPNISSYKETVSAARRASQLCLTAVLVGLIGLNWATVSGRTQPSDNDQPGAQVLTRGPVHEAFAGMVTFNPEPGVVISKAPPEVIEEMPPEERPEGENVSWIPGYWGWDDERSDFLWVSGTWRALPPGRAWMAGYWGQTPRGHQWISGYWADAAVRETTYLPPPPQTVEVGPNIAAPSNDYGWSPGCWVWYQGRYAWQPGYWAQGRADWDWMPSHYVWTPRGYIFVGGYWDYPVQRRGIVFAPVYFESSYYSRRGYVYSPSIVISLGVFSDHLFLRPSYSHYYFGDYYAPSYYQGGFYASFSFQSGRHGYDPFYSRQRWTHRQDRDWERRTETSFQYRRDHEASRPPRTYAAQSSISVSISATERSQMLVAAPIAQVAKRTEGGMRFQSVAKAEREKLSGRGQEVRKSREERRTLEATVANAPSRQPGAVMQPAMAETPRSPIVAKPVKELGRNYAPPEVPKTPQPDLKRQPKSEPAARSGNDERNKPRAEPRQSEPQRKAVPGREEVTPREKPVQPQAQPKPERRPERSDKPTREETPKNDRKSQLPPQPESTPRGNDSAVKAREESQQKVRRDEQQRTESVRQAREAEAKTTEETQRNARGQEKKAQQESEQRTKDAAVQAREESQRNARAAEQKTRQDSEQRAKDTAGRSQADAPRENRGPEKQTRPAPEPRAKEPVVKAREEAPQDAARAVQPTKPRPTPPEKGATRLMKKDQTKERKEKP